MILNIEYLPLTSLKKYKNNSREHDQSQIDQVAASITEFGFTNPILIDESNEIIAGHCRYDAAEQLGIEDVPTIRLVGLSDQKKKAYLIADNKLALNSSWNYEMLKSEIQTLEDFDVEILGFDADEMDLIINGIDLGDDEKDDLQAGEDLAVIKVKCLPLDRHDVFETIDKAIAESGIGNVKIEGVEE